MSFCFRLTYFILSFWYIVHENGQSRHGKLHARQVVSFFGADYGFLIFFVFLGGCGDGDDIGVTWLRFVDDEADIGAQIASNGGFLGYFSLS